MLKQLWETQARFIWDDMQEDGRYKVLMPAFKKKEAVGISQSETEREKYTLLKP